MAQILKGLAVANALTEALTERVAALNKHGITPTLAILRVAHNFAIQRTCQTEEAMVRTTF